MNNNKVYNNKKSLLSRVVILAVMVAIFISLLFIFDQNPAQTSQEFKSGVFMFLGMPNIFALLGLVLFIFIVVEGVILLFDLIERYNEHRVRK